MSQGQLDVEYLSRRRRYESFETYCYEALRPARCRVPVEKKAPERAGVVSPLRQALGQLPRAFVGCSSTRQVELLENDRMRQRLQRRVTSVFVLLYQLLLLYWYLSTREPARGALCGPPAAASVLVL